MWVRQRNTQPTTYSPLQHSSSSTYRSRHHILYAVSRTCCCCLHRTTNHHHHRQVYSTRCDTSFCETIQVDTIPLKKKVRVVLRHRFAVWCFFLPVSSFFFSLFLSSVIVTREKNPMHACRCTHSCVNTQPRPSWPPCSVCTEYHSLSLSATWNERRLDRSLLHTTRESENAFVVAFVWRTRSLSHC